MADDRKKAQDPRGRIEELVEYFEKGKAFTSELMTENERLRMRLLKVEKENLDLKNNSGQDNIDRIMAENRMLREKVEMMENRFSEIEEENNDFAQRFVEIQSQNDNLLNLYVASYQLHATLNPEDVISVIEEIILNLIGAEQFIIFVRDPSKETLTIMAGEGPNGPVETAAVRELDPVMEKVLAEGEPYFRGDDEMESSHLACTPLKVKGEVVGVISITKLMDQKKEGLTPIDHELLSLLADHAATALVSSNLYDRTQRKLKTVEGFLGLLKNQEAPAEG